MSASSTEESYEDTLHAWVAAMAAPDTDDQFNKGLHAGVDAALEFLRSEGKLAPSKPVDTTGWTGERIIAELERAYVYGRQVSWDAVNDLAVAALRTLVLEVAPDARTVILGYSDQHDGYTFDGIELTTGHTIDILCDVYNAEGHWVEEEADDLTEADKHALTLVEAVSGLSDIASQPASDLYHRSSDVNIDPKGRPTIAIV